ncbi:MAG: filamentous hemagglutinin N-terminal domain-containing protein [Nitrospira sp.]|nr:MAG: filamentous hemagglutinin N-terminal domain-containing protein [Nitrospira sp.]
MKHALSFPRERLPVNLSLTRLVVGSCLAYLANFPIACTVHAASAITPSGLDTQVSAPLPAAGGKTQFDITGGTRAGTNLFHSFGQFDVPANNIANFLNDSGPETSNILGRVTGGSPSSIFGTIQTTGFGSANLFLMNPAGIVFGPTASLNVGGSVTFTTSNYLRLHDNVRFNAIQNANADALLSTAPISAYGFLGSTPGTIAIHGSELKVSEASNISLVSGNITVESDTLENGTIKSALLSTPGGQINVASVASPGEIFPVNFMPAPGMTMGNINLSQGTLLNATADAAGVVRIRGGQLTIDNATVSANTINTNGSPMAIDINVTGNITMANNLSPALTARTTGTGNAGTINIKSGNLQATTSSLADGLVALVDTHTSGTGTAGNVAITSGNLHATNEAFFIDTGTAGTGHGGDINIQSTNVMIEGPNIATGNFRFGQLQNQDVRGSAGNLTIRATDGLQIGPAATFSTEAYFSQSGNITLEGRDVSVIGNSFVSVDGDFGGATITVKADQLRLNFASVLNSNTVVDPGGDIAITAKVVELSEGSQIRTSTLGEGTAGDIEITASEQLRLDGRKADNPGLPSAIVSNFYALDPGPEGIGGSGSITINTPQLRILDGALINTSTNNSGNAGDISVFSRSVTISGQSQFEVSNASIGIGSTRGSGIYTRTVGIDLCTGPCGNAGNITIATDSLSLVDGGTINSGTTNDGFGGNIAITARQSVTVENNSTISANSTGSGDAGGIFINAGQQLDLTNSSITTTTQSGLANGGNIDIRAIDRIRFVNSTISTSVLGEDGSGGNIFIDPKVVVLQGSTVTAQAVGGTGGNITFVTPLFLADSASVISASSQRGVSGTVTIQSPTSNLSGTVGQLASKTNPPQVLLQNRCIALAGGEQSTFILAGRYALPSEPGGWLSSPVAMEHWTGEKPEDHVSRLMVRSRGWNTQPPLVVSKDKSTVLSLRRLTPPGFLVRSFATGTTGCPS